MRAPAASSRLPPPPPRARTAPAAEERRPIVAAKPVPWLRRLFMWPEPTAYHRCLAIHIHYASSQRTLS